MILSIVGPEDWVWRIYCVFLAEILDLLVKKYLKSGSTLSKILKQNSNNEVAIEIMPEILFKYD